MAGQQAGLRADTVAARNLLERALALAPGGDQLRARIAIDLAEELLAAGELARVDELLTSVERHPDAAGMAALMRLEWRHLSHPDEAIAEIEARLPGLLEELSAAGDENGLARAHMLAFFVHWLRSLGTPAAHEIRLAAEHAARAGNEGLRARALAYYVSTLVYGPTDANAIPAELEWVQSEGRGAYVQGFIEWGRSTVALLDGRLAEARLWAERSTETCAALGITMRTLGLEGISEVERAEGSLDAALALLEHLQRRLPRVRRGCVSLHHSGPDRRRESVARRLRRGAGRDRAVRGAERRR